MQDQPTMIIVLLSMTVLTLLVLAAVLLYRYAKDRQALQTMRRQLAVFDRLLSSDQRVKFWLYADGRIQGNSQLKDIFKLQALPTHLDDLSDHLPPDVMDYLHHAQNSQGSSLSAGYKNNQAEALEQPEIMMIKRQGQDDLALTVKLVRHVPMQMPHALVSLEKVPTSQRFSGAGPTHNLLTYQLNEALDRVDAIALPVWVWDQEGHLLQVNEAYVKAVEGHTSRTVVEQERWLFDPHQGKAFDSLIEKIHQRQEPIQERHFTIVDGERRAFLVMHCQSGRHSEPQQQYQTEYQGHSNGVYVSVAIDISAEEEAMSELSKVLESQSVTLNRLASPVAIFGPDQSLKFYNQAFQKLSGLGENSLAEGITHNDLLEEMRILRRLPEQADFKTWKSEILKRYTGLLDPVEEMWHQPDGSSYRVLTQPHPLGGLLLLFEDMTDQLALERSVNTLLAVQNETLENLHEAVAVFGPDGKLRLFNRGFVYLWGLDEVHDIQGHLTDQHILDIIKLAERVYKQRYQNAAQGEDAFQMNPEQAHLFDQLPAWLSSRQQQTGHWRNMDHRIIDYALVPLPDGSSLLTQTDITDSFNMQTALRERSQALEAADKLKSEFIANMAYELRTPLNSIMGFSNLLLQGLYGDLSDKQMTVVTDVSEAAENLNRLISNVLNIAAIDSEGTDLTFEPLDLTEEIEALKAMIGERILHKEAHIHWQQEPDLPKLEADQARLRQACYSLIAALMTISSSAASLSVVFYRQDKNHIGIKATLDEAVIESQNYKLLLQSFRSDGSLSQQDTGSLDLVLVRSVAGLHGGRLEMQENQDKGIEIQLILPIHSPHHTS